jgi:hypothetical protein
MWLFKGKSSEDSPGEDRASSSFPRASNEQRSPATGNRKRPKSFGAACVCLPSPTLSKRKHSDAPAPVDMRQLRALVDQYARQFNQDPEEILKEYEVRFGFLHLLDLITSHCSHRFA